MGSEKGGPKRGTLKQRPSPVTSKMASDESSRPTIEELWAELDAAEAAVASFGPSPEQLREEAAEAERLAKENGTPAKSAKVIGVLRRRWSDFLELHGEAYGYEAEDGPTIELAVHFQVSLPARDGRVRAWRRGRVCRVPS